MQPITRLLSLCLALSLLGACQAAPATTGTGRGVKSAARPVTATTPQSNAPAPVAPSSTLRGVVSLDAHYLLTSGIAQIREDADTRVVDALAGLRRASGLVGNDAASLVGNDAASLIARDGVTLLGQDGAAVVGASVSQGRLIANGGGNLIANGGGNLIANGGGNLRGGGTSYRLRGVDRVAPGTVVPAAGMVVQLIDLRSGLPVVMVDSKGRAGDAVLTDASGRYEVYVPESVTHNVLVRVHAPGQLADARLRYARVTAPQASQPDVHDDVSAVSLYFRGALAAKLLYLISRDVGRYLQRDNLAEQLVVKGLKPTLDELTRSGVHQWSKSDQYLLARRMADRVLARVKDWENLPLMMVDQSGSEEDITARFVVALLTGQPVPRSSQVALREMADVMQDFMAIGATKMNAGYDFAAENPIFKLVNRYALEWQDGHFGGIERSEQPPWLRAGGFQVKSPKDLCEFLVRAFVMSDKEWELSTFLTARKQRTGYDSVLQDLRGLGVDEQDVKRWWETRADDYYAQHDRALAEFVRLGLVDQELDSDGPGFHFVRLLRTLGQEPGAVNELMKRLHVSAASIMAVLTVELMGDGGLDVTSVQQEFIEDIRYYATPAGRDELRALSSLQDS